MELQEHQLVDCTEALDQKNHEVTKINVWHQDGLKVKSTSQLNVDQPRFYFTYRCRWGNCKLKNSLLVLFCRYNSRAMFRLRIGPWLDGKDWNIQHNFYALGQFPPHGTAMLISISFSRHLNLNNSPTWSWWLSFQNGDILYYWQYTISIISSCSPVCVSLRWSFTYGHQTTRTIWVNLIIPS